jgi:Rhs element Vgr protein
MPDTRTLPIAAEHREFAVKAGDRVVSREHQLVGVTVTAIANKIASARLVYVDGAAASGRFPLADSDTFAPGRKVEILAGSGRDATSLFIGKVVRVGLRVREGAASQFVVDCRHAAMKLTVAERCADFFDQTDSDIIGALLDGAGVGKDVEATTVSHKQVLQYHATDWDFLLARAAANGQLVWCEGEKVVVRKPALGGASVCTLNYGATLLEFDGEIDARRQSAIAGTSWDAAGQQAVEVEATTPSFRPPGNLTHDALADVAGQTVQLRHAAVPEAEIQAWADGQALVRQVDQVCGRGKCQGIAIVKPGVVVELAGLGQRFNGQAFVTGVRHEFSLVQGWKTHVQFGGAEPEALPLGGRQGVSGLVPAAQGLQIGVVTDIVDPDSEFRIRVRLPMLGLSSDGVWARVASLDAGDDRGFVFRPEVGDEVTVGFLGDDPRYPVVLGMLHSSAKPAPIAPDSDNHEKMFKSRSGMTVHFDDDKVVLTLATPAGNQLVLDEDQGSVTLADQNGNTLTLDSDGVHIESAGKIEFKAPMDASFEGLNISLKASAQLSLEGSASAELKGGGMAKVTGAMVQIN